MHRNDKILLSISLADAKNHYYLLIVYIYNACANFLSITVVFFAKSNKKRRRILKMHCIDISFWKFVKKDVAGAVTRACMDGRCSYMVKKCRRRRRYR